MIAFGPDTDVPVTPVQRFARRALVGACGFVALGVVTSVARLSAAPLVARVSPGPSAARPSPAPQFVIEPVAAPVQAQFAVMAAARPAARPVVELVREVAPAVLAARPATVRWMLVTAYCPCVKCCGKYAMGLTASGKPTTANYGHFVAAPAELPFRSRVTVPGYNRNRAVPVLDRGGAIKGNRLDVYFPSHEEARQWGRRWVPVTVVAD